MAAGTAAAAPPPTNQHSVSRLQLVEPAAGGPRRGAGEQGGLLPDTWLTPHPALSSGAHYYPQLGVHTLQQ